MGSGTRCSGKCCTGARPPRPRELHRKVAAALERERAEGAVSAAELAMHFELGRDPMPALGYYVEAAEAALMHVSPSERDPYRARLDASRPGAERRARHSGDRARHASWGMATYVLGVGSTKRRAPSSARTRCSIASRNIPCAHGCCTDSVFCFGCAPTMSRRLPWRNEPYALVRHERSGPGARRTHHAR